MKILFSDEKMFDIDGVYNSQNKKEFGLLVVWKLMQKVVSSEGESTLKK